MLYSPAKAAAPLGSPKIPAPIRPFTTSIQIPQNPSNLGSFSFLSSVVVPWSTRLLFLKSPIWEDREKVQRTKWVLRDWLSGKSWDFRFLNVLRPAGVRLVGS